MKINLGQLFKNHILKNHVSVINEAKTLDTQKNNAAASNVRKRSFYRNRQQLSLLLIGCLIIGLLFTGCGIGDLFTSRSGAKNNASAESSANETAE